MFTEKNYYLPPLKSAEILPLKNIRTLLPAILIWFALETGIRECCQVKLPIENERNILMTVILFINNVISGLVIIYLFLVLSVIYTIAICQRLSSIRPDNVQIMILSFLCAIM